MSSLSRFVRLGRIVSSQNAHMMKAISMRSFHSSRKMLSENIPEKEIEYLPVFKYDKSTLYRFVGTGLTAQLVFWAGNTAFVTLSDLANGMSPVVPMLGTVVSAATLWMVQRQYNRTVKEIAIIDDESPVRVKTYGLFGQEITNVYERSDFLGLPAHIDSTTLANSHFKFHVLRVKGINYFLQMNKSGLFDLSGVLNGLTGYDLTTFERCSPSEPYHPRSKRN